MKREEIISGIKEAEGNARSILESARHERDARVSRARLEAERIVADAGAEAGRSAEAAVAKARSDISRECDALLHSGLNEIELYREKARKNVPKARELLLESFEGYFHA